MSSPGHLHGVLGEIDDPVDQVESAERQREEDAGVFVDDAGAGQNVVGRDSGALLQEGLGVDGRVGKRFGGTVKERRRVHPLLQHAAGVHLGEAKRRRCRKDVRKDPHERNITSCNMRGLIIKLPLSCYTQRVVKLISHVLRILIC